MLERICLSVKPVIIVYVFLFMGCQKNNDQVLATIEGKDTITVNQFRILIEKRYGKDAADLTLLEKRKYLEFLVQERLKLSYAIEKGYDKGIAIDEERMKHSVLLNKAYDKYILGYFLSEKNVQDYRQNIGVTITVQNLIIPFKNSYGFPGTLTKEEARKKVDSVCSIINVNNFNRIVEQNSYDKNSTNRITFEKIRIGELPFSYEKALCMLRKNEISVPIELQGAFVIVHVIARNESTIKKMNSVEVRKLLKSKFVNDDYFMVQDFRVKFLDSLYRLASADRLEKNILFLLSKLKDTVNVRASTSRFTTEELDLNLMHYTGGGITIKHFLESHEPGLSLKLTKDLVTEGLNSICGNVLLEKLIISEDFLKSDEYQLAMSYAKHNILLRQVHNELISSYTGTAEPDLQDFFLRNRGQYRTDGTIVVSEITSPDRKNIQTMKEAISSGVGFEKAVEIQKIHDKGMSAKLDTNISFNFVTRNEVVALAQRMDKKEISDVLIRKDGSFSLIKVVEKTEPTMPTFESVRRKVENDYRIDQLKSWERELLSNLKKRWKVVMYENNLNRI